MCAAYAQDNGNLTWAYIMERVTRIELALSAWEADVLPLNYTRERPSLYQLAARWHQRVPPDRATPDLGGWW